MIRIILFALVLLFPAYSQATVYYVATTGNDTTGDGSSGNPWRNPQKCVTTISAGDTCTVANGTYTDSDSDGHVVNITNAGTSNAVKTLQATNPGGVILQLPADPHGQGSGVRFGGGAAWWVIDGFEITGGTADSSAGNTFDGILISGGTISNITIKRNKIHDIGRTVCSLSPYGWSGIFTEGTVTNITVTRNLIYKVGRLRQGESGCSYLPGADESQADHGIYWGKGSSSSITRNVLYGSTGYDLQFYNGGLTGVTNITVDNNTFIGSSQQTINAGCVILGIPGLSGTIRNNIFYACKTKPFGDTIGAQGSITFDYNLTDNAGWWNTGQPSGVTDGGHNLVSTSPGFTNAGSNDYTLASGSAAINAGTGTCNGVCDIGAFETFGLSACSVANATSSVINATFENNVSPPLLPSTGVTTFTARKATVNDVVTGVVRTGDNQLDITVTNAFVAGNAIDISWASGNLTDSALIGGTLNQSFLPITNSACTNNVGGSPSHLFIQAKFEFHGLRGTEASPVVLPYSAAAEDTNINVVVGGKARLRLALTCTTADCPPVGFYLYYSKDGGAYAVVPDSFGADNIAFCGTNSDPDIPSSGTTTTDQLSTAGTFVAAAVVRTSNAIPTIDLAQNNKTEPEYCLAWDTDATADSTYDFRIRKQDGTVIDTYTVTPRATLRAMSAGLGF